MRLCFIGASRFGFRCLKAVMKIPGVEVVAILTTTREFKISYSPERPVTNVLFEDFHILAAQDNSPRILTMQSSMKEPDVIRFIKDTAPDFILVVGWYHMIPANIREIPPKGIAGIHASLLPKYSGGAPLVWAIINGEMATGLTLFYFDEGVDDGDIIGQRHVAIRLNDTIATLYGRVEDAGVSLLEEMLPLIAAGTAPRTPQDEAERTTWPQRKPEDGEINWDAPALSIYNFVRAQTSPYPGAFTYRKGKKLTIWEAKLCDFAELKGEAGQVLNIIDCKLARGFLISSKDNDVSLLVTRVGTEKNETLDAYDYAMKENLVIGEILGRASSSIDVEN